MVQMTGLYILLVREIWISDIPTNTFTTMLLTNVHWTSPLKHPLEKKVRLVKSYSKRTNISLYDPMKSACAIEWSLESHIFLILCSNSNGDQLYYFIFKTDDFMITHNT